MKTENKAELAAQIVQKLRQKGFAAYLVGGCVRDMLMRKTSKDFDITTQAGPEEIKKIFPENTYPVGAKFGTLLVVQHKVSFQVSTFRGKRSKSSVGLLEDVRARDFTINGLVYEPINGKIIDLVDGRADIRRKRICAIGRAKDKFKEDPLRLLRAIRLATTLGFTIQDQTLQAIRRMSSCIKGVSKERIRDELISILVNTKASSGLKLLDQTGLLKHVLPAVEKLKGVKQPPVFHPEGDVFTHTLLMLEKLKKPSLVLSLACLFHDIAKPQTFQVCDRIRFNGHDRLGAKMCEKILKELRFSHKDREDIVSCVENHMRIMEAPKMRDSTLKRLFARPTFEQELKLHYLDCIASHRDLKVWRFLKKRYKGFKNSPIIPKPILNGCELIKLGFTPGPIFGKIHKEMVDLQLEAKLNSKSAARKWVMQKFITKTPKPSSVRS